MRILRIVFALLSLAVLAAAADKPTILILYDMEGVSGVDSVEMTRFANAEAYARGRQFLTNDVNAAIRGLKAAGAGAIWVTDGHGSGNSTGPDLLLDQLDKGAQFAFQPFQFDQYSTGITPAYDAIVCIAMHARGGTNGFLAHTYNPETRFRINGMDFSETHIVAASGARYGIPVIMVSGDDVLGEQLKGDFPELQFAVVKTAQGRAKAQPFPPEEVARRIETAARSAMENLRAGKFRPFYVRPPFEFEMTFLNQQERDLAARNPLVQIAGENSVRFVAPDFVSGYELSKVIMSLSSDRLALLTRLLQQTPEGKKYLDELDRALIQRWTDPEKTPAWMTPPATPPRKQWWGAS